MPTQAAREEEQPGRDRAQYQARDEHRRHLVWTQHGADCGGNEVVATPKGKHYPQRLPGHSQRRGKSVLSERNRTVPIMDLVEPDPRRLSYTSRTLDTY